jgi:hypothetical protein
MNSLNFLPINTSQFPRPSTWVLVTGKIRDQASLSHRFEFLGNLKKSGLVEQVVFSTWVGELERHPEIFGQVVENGFLTVESTEPKVVAGGHYLHQIVQLTNGLDACSPRSFILRTRTDKCGPEAGFIEEQIVNLLSRQTHTRLCGGNLPRFQFKIGLPGYHNYLSEIAPLLFWWNDRLYFGLREDLQKFLNFNVLSLSFLDLIPEQALFTHPFRERSSVLRQFFSAFPQGQIANKVYWAADKHSIQYRTLIDFLKQNTLFKLALFLERYLLHTHFFDLSSGEDIPYATEFAGEAMLKTSDSEALRFGESLLQDDFSVDLGREAESAKSFLLSNWDIHSPTRRESREDMISRRFFVTPDEQLSIRS